jgi:hypothetical protein
MPDLTVLPAFQSNPNSSDGQAGAETPDALRRLTGVMTFRPKVAALVVFAAALVLSACGSTSTATPGSTATALPATATATPATTPEGISLLTEPAPAQACMDALARGTLVPDPRSGLALASPTGERTPVMWPFGYSARLVDAVIELVDSSGNFVAREGDTVEMGGGFGGSGLFYACGDGIRRV